MPVNEGEEGQYEAPPQEAAPAPPPPGGVTLPPGYAGPVLPAPGGGMRGALRFEAEQNMMSKLKPGTQKYREWILSLKEDPTDPEYTRLVRQAKADLLKTRITGPGGVTGDQTAGSPAASADQPAFPNTGGKSAISVARDKGKSDDSEGDIDKILSDAAAPTEEDEIKQQKDWRRKADNYKTPVFRGRPVGSDDLYSPDDAQDPFVDDWLTEQGIKLDANSRRKALRSGQYVYMGQEYNPELGVYRDVYVYKDDAGAASQSLDPSVLSGYQKELGLQVTGRMDPYLQPIWEEAVKFAQDSARNGQKISVREWFDLFVQSAIAKKKAGASGGGAANPEEFDYYRGMMQVLGDISGVGG